MRRRDVLKLLATSVAAGASGALDRLTADARNVTSFVPDVEFEMTAAPGEVSILPGEPTRVWQFRARLVHGPADTLSSLHRSYLGPIVRLRRGQKVRVRFRNELAEDSIVHWHGLDVPQAADGHPRLAIGHADEYVYEFEVTNRAGAYWYHPHPHMRTGAQVYQGLAGLIIIEDVEERALALPAGDAEHLCVLQDRRFDGRNQLVFHGASMMEMMNGFLGDRILVNGLPQPTIDVDAGWQRIRLLNGSNARIYKLAWSRDVQMTLIGSDGGLFERPLRQRVLTLAPAQRADLLVDLTGLAAGTEIHLDSLPFPERDAGVVGMMGMMGGRNGMANGTGLRVMTMRTRARKGRPFRLPDRLSMYGARWSSPADAHVRNIPLTFQRMQWLIDGRTFGMTDVAAVENVTAGSTHLWEFRNVANAMGMQAAHPMHIHGPQFRVLSRSGGAAANALREGLVDQGWRDTVLVLPGESVRVQVTFTQHPGLYLYHCHILEHEDMGMMRNFRVA